MRSPRLSTAVSYCDAEAWSATKYQIAPPASPPSTTRINTHFNQTLPFLFAIILLVGIRGVHLRHDLLLESYRIFGGCPCHLYCTCAKFAQVLEYSMLRPDRRCMPVI